MGEMRENAIITSAFIKVCFVMVMMIVAIILMNRTVPVPQTISDVLVVVVYRRTGGVMKIKTAPQVLMKLVAVSKLAFSNGEFYLKVGSVCG